MAGSEAGSEEEQDYEFTRKFLYLPENEEGTGPKRIRLRSPRFTASLAENGVLLEELYEPDIERFYGRSGDWALAEKEWEVADSVRREKLELVLAARAAKVAPKPDDAGAAESKEPPAHELLSGSSLVALEKEHIAKVMAKRNKKESFEQNQAEFFAARHRETVETAQRKHDAAEAFRKKLAEEQAAKFAAKGEAFARKQQNARDGFRRWEEGKEEQRRQMYERDAAVAARSMQFEEERDMDLFNRSMDFAAKVEMCGERSQVRRCPLALAAALALALAPAPAWSRPRTNLTRDAWWCATRRCWIRV